MEKCQNCGSGIGELETPYVWNNRVVCRVCHSRLKTNGGEGKGMRMIVAGVVVAVLLVGLGAAVMLGGVPRWTTKSKVESPTAVIKTPKRGRIEGSAWITRNDGATNLLPGLRVQLLKPSVDGETVRLAYTNAMKGHLKNMEEHYAEMARWQNNIGGGPPGTAARSKLYLQEIMAKEEVIVDAAKNLHHQQDVAEVYDVLEKSVPSTSWVTTFGVSPSFADMAALTAAIPFQVIVDKTTVMEMDTGVEAKYEFSDIPAGRYYLYAHFESTGGNITRLIPLEVANRTSLRQDLHNGTARAIR